SKCVWLGMTVFSRSNEQEMREFESMPLPQKYVTYICAEQYLHPPAIEFGTKFASEGGRAVPFLKQKLVEAGDDLTIRDIVFVFFEMQMTKSYAVSADASLMSLLRQKAQSTTDSFWRNMAEESVTKIAEHK